jgi:hypothetical protein
VLAVGHSMDSQVPLGTRLDKANTFRRQRPPCRPKADHLIKVPTERLGSNGRIRVYLLQINVTEGHHLITEDKAIVSHFFRRVKDDLKSPRQSITNTT